MSETKTTRPKVVKALKSLHAIPVENSVRSGVPDVNFAGGWVECKRLAKWPARAESRPVRFGHPLSIQQANFLRRRWMMGELALLCVHVDREWMFYAGHNADEIFDKSTAGEMRRLSIFYMKKFNQGELLSWVKSML